MPSESPGPTPRRRIWVIMFESGEWTRVTTEPHITDGGVLTHPVTGQKFSPSAWHSVTPS